MTASSEVRFKIPELGEFIGGRDNGRGAGFPAFFSPTLRPRRAPTFPRHAWAFLGGQWTQLHRQWKWSTFLWRDLSFL